MDLNGKTVKCSDDYAFYIAGNYAVLKNGTISEAGVSVHANAPKSSIEKLSITSAPDKGIFVGKSKVAGNIKNNKISSPNGPGINVQGTVAGSISGNRITKCRSKENGSICLMRGGTVKGKISDNVISGGKSHGIQMFSKCKSGDIVGNKISSIADRGILITGASGTSKNDGSRAGNITGNTLTNVKAHGISIYHGSRVGHITKNTLKNIGGKNNKTIGDYAITINAGCKFETYAKSIKNNTINNVTYAGIVVFSGPDEASSKKWQDNGHIKGDISGNTVIKSASYKKKVNWNRTNQVCQGAIYVDSHARVYGNICNNTVKSSYDDGINILAYSRVKNIYGNKISGARYAGIAVCNNSTVLGKVYKNSVSGTKFYGLFVNNRGRIKGRVTGNTFKGAGVNGVHINKSSKVSKFINNKVIGAKLYGLISTGKSKVSEVSGNTISTKHKKNSISIIANDKSPIAMIKGNKISGRYACGIRVKYPGKKVKVLKNVLKSGNPKGAKSLGINIEGCKNKTIKIQGNKITGNKTGPGIYIRTSRVVARKNSFKKCRSKIGQADRKYKLSK